MSSILQKNLALSGICMASILCRIGTNGPTWDHFRTNDAKPLKEFTSAIPESVATPFEITCPARV